MNEKSLSQIRKETKRFLFNGETIICDITTDISFGVKSIEFAYTTEKRETAATFIKLLNHKTITLLSGVAVVSVAPYYVEVKQLQPSHKNAEELFIELFNHKSP